MVHVTNVTAKNIRIIHTILMISAAAMYRIVLIGIWYTWNSFSGGIRDKGYCKGFFILYQSIFTVFLILPHGIPPY